LSFQTEEKEIKRRRQRKGSALPSVLFLKKGGKRRARKDDINYPGSGDLGLVEIGAQLPGSVGEGGHGAQQDAHELHHQGDQHQLIQANE